MSSAYLRKRYCDTVSDKDILDLNSHLSQYKIYRHLSLARYSGYLTSEGITIHLRHTKDFSYLPHYVVPDDWTGWVSTRSSPCKACQFGVYDNFASDNEGRSCDECGHIIWFAIVVNRMWRSDI